MRVTPATTDATDDPDDDRRAVERRVDVDGRPIAYATYGSPDGAPVVLFHGTPGSRLLGELYDRAARDRGLRVLVPDRPGFGESPSWKERTLRDSGSIATAILDDVGCDRAGVVGFSGGGAHALATATTHPDRTVAVDLVSTAAPPTLRGSTPPTQRVLGTLAETAPLAVSGVLRASAWLATRRQSVALAGLTADPTAIPDRVAAAAARDFVEGIGPRRAGFLAETRLLESSWDLPLDELRHTVRLWHGIADDNAPIDGAHALADRLPTATLRPFEGEDHLTTLLESRDAVLDYQADAAGR